jgi:D-threo-aldose 1-dehydrogenase
MIELSKTGDPVSDRLVFGVGRLKGDLGIREATVRRAYDLGIRYFDASIAYGHGAAHSVLARLIDAVPADNLHIATKIGHFRDGFPQAMSLYRSEETLWGLVHECYRSLLGKIDLLQIHEADMTQWWTDDHSPDAERYVTPATDTVPGPSPVVNVLERAKKLGVCASVGVTGNTARPLAEVVRRIPVDSVMCAYNLDPVFRGTLEHVVPAARERGAVVLAAGVLQGGAYRSRDSLTDRLLAWPAVPEKFAEFARIEAESGLSAVELLIRWALSVDGVDRWIVGGSSPEQVEDTVAIVRRGPLSPDLQSAIDALGVEGMDSSNTARSWLARL